MSLTLEVVFAIVVALGIICCILPILPGQMLAYGGLFVLLWTETPPTVEYLTWMGVACLAVTVADFLFPAWLAKRFGGSRAGGWGSLVGTLVGAAFFPVGLVVGAFCGAMLFEKFFAHRSWSAAIVAGVGAFLGFLSGTAVKVAYCVMCLLAEFR